MADNNGVPRRKPVPQRPAPDDLPENWAADLTIQFRRTLSTKRMNELSRSGSRKRPCSRSRIPSDIVVQSPPPLPRHLATDSASPASPPPPPSRDAPMPPRTPQPEHASTFEPPPSYSSLKNLPTMATPPTDQRSMRFRNLLLSLSNTPLKWENPGLLDEALLALPLQRIYDEAQEESDILTAEAASLGPNTKPAWGYQDCVIRSLMRWFKKDFFEWVNHPKCSTCGAPTVGRGIVAPLADEAARGASRVELYQCAHQLCQSFERLPRYNDAFVLMQTKRGRVGEWANCFTMLCRAVGSRVRWVWAAEDHVWTEVYSVHRRRWVHVDSCEGAWDAPRLYSEGWGKKLSYCIAFSAEGCVDVTRRYVRNPAEHGLPRARCTEGELMHIVNEITSMRRRDMDKKNRFQLQAEDMREDAELRKFIIEAIAYNVGRIAPGGDGEKAALAARDRNDPDAQKAAEAASSRHQESARARGDQSQQTQPPRPRDQRQQ